MSPQNPGSGSTNGSGIDCGSPSGLTYAIQSLGSWYSEDSALVSKMQESDSGGGTYTDIPSAIFTPRNAAGGADVVEALTFRRSKQWVRWTGTITGSGSPGVDMAALVMVLTPNPTDGKSF